MNPVTASMLAIFMAALGENGQHSPTEEQRETGKEFVPVLENGSLDGLIGIRPLSGVEELFSRQTIKRTLNGREHQTHTQQWKVGANLVLKYASQYIVVKEVLLICYSSLPLST